VVGWIERLEGRVVPATITVNTTADGDFRDAAVTFREALLIANGSLPVGSLSPQEQALVSGTVNTGVGSAADAIVFNIPGGGIATLAVTAPLPEASEPVVIDATTQPGFSPNTLAVGTNSVLRVVLPASLVLTGGSTVRGLSMPLGGLFLRGGSNRVESSWIGVLPDGVSAPGSVPGALPQTGIIVESSGNQIGGESPALRNLISGNNQSGIRVFGGATGTVIRGNLIGTDATGTAAVPNGTGIWVSNASGTTIGGTGEGGRNVVSGNRDFGVLLIPEGSGQSVTGTLLQGNRIGTNAAGTAALGNAIGVLVTAQGTTIGGTAPGAGNLISGNRGGGVGVVNASATQIVGNLVGTNGTGLAAVPNGEAGVAVRGGSGTTIGGTAEGARNVVSGNLGHGVFLANPGAGTLVQANFIGVAADGFSVLRNFGSGVRVAGATGLLIGGATVEAGNVINFNGDGGVVVESGTGVQIRTNSIYGNLGQGIDLNADGPSANDPGDADGGANNGLNHPVLTSVTGDAATTTVQGTYSGPANTAILFQFFASPFADPSGRGEGQVFLGAATVTTDGSGNVNFVATLPTGTAPGQPVTAVAIDPTGNTSEFSRFRPRATATQTDLAVEVSSSATSVIAGQDVTYTVTVTNAGPNPATNVSLVSGLGAGSVLRSVTLSKGTFSAATGAVEASLGTLAPGESATATLVTQTIFAGETFVSGLVYSAETDSNEANNGAARIVTVGSGPDVRVTVAAPSTAPTGADVTFTYTVRNAGPGPASNVVLTSQVPTGASLVAVQASMGTVGHTQGVVTAELGTLAAQQEAVVTIVLRRAEPGALAVNATATLDELDPDPSNNQASATTQIESPLPRADLVVRVQAAPSPGVVGLPLTFEVVVENLGAGAATAARLIAQLGPDLVIVQAASTQGTVSVTGTQVEVDLGAIAAGAASRLVVIATPTAVGATSLTATVTAGNEVNPGNNTATGTVAIEPAPANTIIRDMEPFLIAGRLRGYRLVFSNPIDPVTALAPRAIQIVAPGRDGQLGTADDQNVRIRRIGYDFKTQTLTLMVRGELPLNRFVMVEVRGSGPDAVIALGGVPIDGDGDGIPGGDFVATIGRGRDLSYIDADGDRVQIRLRGPRGTMDLVRGPLGNARVVRIVNAHPRRTTLSGSVRRRVASDGVASIPQIVGLETVRNRLPAGQFQVGVG
jgi:uncharacterized repeat protein (TIGR01451 family)